MALIFLTLAAVLEAGGDALVRHGLFSGSGATRFAFIVLGGLVLLLYGCSVNLPRWDFGRLLGVYVALFFVVAQAIAWIAFHERPSLGILVGGALIVSGGLVMTLWRT